jgi:carbonic anhydrase
LKTLADLFARNRAWAEKIRRADPEFFSRLTHQQAPQYFWIGCSDSRVPANEIVNLLPGEMFVHRNVANIVSPADPNCLSALQFAVEVLRVRHVIVCGHYGCSGIRAAMRGDGLGLVDKWLQPVKVLQERCRRELGLFSDESRRHDLLCELNIKEQVINVCATESVQRAWNSGQVLSVHGWIYAVSDGLLRDLDVCISSPEEYESANRSRRARELESQPVAAAVAPGRPS